MTSVLDELSATRIAFSLNIITKHECKLVNLNRFAVSIVFA